MKSFIRFLTIAVIVVAAGVAVWFGVHRTQIASAPEPSSSVSASPMASVSPLVMTYGATPKDWKTFSSTSMGFSVSYPPDWREGVCGTQCVGFSPSSTASDQFVLGILESTDTTENLLAKAQQYLVGKETVKLGTLSWLKLTLQQPQTGVAVTSHFIAHGPQLFEFGTATSDKDVISVYGKMIASFKFLK